MDSAQSALDSLRTVEFRETLKGYHRDDVDEYLEKAAVEAEGLQEQFRQANDRFRQAGERIAQLESALERQPEPATCTRGSGRRRRHLAADPRPGSAVRRPDQGRLRGPGVEDVGGCRRALSRDDLPGRVEGCPHRLRGRAQAPRRGGPSGGSPDATLRGCREDGSPSRRRAEPAPFGACPRSSSGWTTTCSRPRR